mmetsp:Transcript_13350/g.49959  ORF Transcript_13350/g.49959 Transcript_13350/m.49959 type:complete len:123 (+) Transcript_13350:215-583(+)
MAREPRPGASAEKKDLSRRCGVGPATRALLDRDARVAIVASSPEAYERVDSTFTSRPSNKASWSTARPVAGSTVGGVRGLGWTDGRQHRQDARPINLEASHERTPLGHARGVRPHALARCSP